jgi:NHL repeat
VSTLAGSPGLNGSVDGIGAAARFGRPNGLTTDSAGNVYVADSINHTIRKITPAGVVSTVVGATGQQGFVPGPLPGVLSFPVALAVSGSSLYVTTAYGVARVQPVP